MTIRARVEDCIGLHNAKRFEGALLMALVAIAATSRKRFPLGTPSARHPGKDMGDREAFETFFKSAITTVMPFYFGGRGGIALKHDGRTVAVEAYFYEYMRCALVHEGAIDTTLQLVQEDPPGHWSLRNDGRVDVRWIERLLGMVIRARENAPDFDDMIAAAAAEAGRT